MPLTKKQKAVLDYIVSFMDAHDYMPSYRDIAKGLGLSSPATIYEHMVKLKENGYLQEGGAIDGRQTVSLPEKISALTESVALPLVGLITAGEPIEAVEDTETIAVPTDLVVDVPNSYVLKVKGQSMIDEGILSGDYIIVQRNPSPSNGSIVVALLDKEYATLKKFYKEKGRVRLQPANAAMKPIYSKKVLVQGVVKGIIRKYK